MIALLNYFTLWIIIINKDFCRSSDTLIYTYAISLYVPSGLGYSPVGLRIKLRIKITFALAQECNNQTVPDVWATLQWQSMLFCSCWPFSADRSNKNIFVTTGIKPNWMNSRLPAMALPEQVSQGSSVHISSANTDLWAESPRWALFDKSKIASNIHSYCG